MKKVIALLLALTMLFALAACGGDKDAAAGNSADPGTSSKPGTSSTPGTSAKPDNSGSAEAKDNDLVVLIASDIDSFDNCISAKSVQTQVLPLIHGKLVHTDENGNIYNVMVESIENPDKLTWIFKIHDGLKFSDGSDLTSEDVAYSVQRAKDSPLAARLFAPVEKIEVVDELSIKITTSGPHPLMELALCHVTSMIVSKDYCENQAEADGWANPPCAGPYKIESRTIGDSIKLVPNEYYNLEEMKPENTSLTFKVVPEASSRTIMLEAGDADVIFGFQSSDYDRVNSNPDLSIYTAPSATMYYMAMDTKTNEYFSNKLVRQAVNYAIDREACCVVGYNGYATPLYSYTAPTCSTYLENPQGYTYNPEKAKELLAQAGYPNGFSTTMVVSGETGTVVAETVQAYLAAVGIKAEIKLVEDTSLYVNMAPNGELPLSIATWGTLSDPGYFINRILGTDGLGGYNFAQYVNAEVDALFAEAANTLDQERRDECYKEALIIMAEEAPWAPILNPSSFSVLNANLQGVIAGSYGLKSLAYLHY